MMIYLNKGPKYPYVFINGDLSPNIVRTLDMETSIQPQNIDFILRNRKSDEPWDGRIHIMRKSKNGTFYIPIGLTEKIIKVLGFYDIHPEINLVFSSSEEKITIPWIGPELYTHQIDGFVEAMKTERCIINLPTGSGKTALSIRLISAIGKPTLILLNRKELATQWKKAIKQYTGLDAVIFNDKNKVFGEITIAMLGSLHNYLKNNPLPIFDVLISDECQHVPAKTIYQTTMKCDARYRFGFSATTEREDGMDLFLEAAFGPTCITIRAEELIDQKLLAKPVFEFIDVPASGYSRYSNYTDEYKHNIILNEQRNKAIVSRVKQLVKDGRTIYIHVTIINHGKLLGELLKAPFLYSKSKNREQQVEKFKSGETPVLISTLLGEGFDLGGIDVIIMASGGKSEIATIQRVGRALRPKEGKTALVIDFVDKGRYVSRHTQDRYNAYIKHYGSEYVNKGRK